MADQDSSLPVKDSSDGVPGSAVPSIAIQVGGSDGTNLRTLSTDTSGKLKVNLDDGAGTALTSTLNSGKQALDVNVTNSFAAGIADKSAFTYGTSIENAIGGVFQDTSPTLTAGQQGAARVTANRALHNNLRDSSGNELLGQKTMVNSVPVVISSDQTVIPVSQSGTWTVQQGSTPTSIANAWSIKLTDGTDTALVSTNGDVKVTDGLRNGGVYGALSIPTANTAVEAKVGASRLVNRKSLVITATTTGLFWGTDSSVTVVTGQPLFNNQVIVFDIDPDSTFQVWLVSASATRTARVTESP